MESKKFPGKKLSKFDPYGFEKHLEKFGSSDNYLRTERLSQPRALRKGDIFITGENVISDPRKAVNGETLIYIRRGIESGFWIGIASCIPIALKHPTNMGQGKFARAINLNKGDILATGDRLLSDPYVIEEGSVSLHLTGYQDGHNVRVLSNIPIALLCKEDNAPEELWDIG